MGVLAEVLFISYLWNSERIMVNWYITGTLQIHFGYLSWWVSYATNKWNVWHIGMCWIVSVNLAEEKENDLEKSRFFIFFSRITSWLTDTPCNVWLTLDLIPSDKFSARSCSLGDFLSCVYLSVCRLHFNQGTHCPISTPWMGTLGSHIGGLLLPRGTRAYI